MTDWEELAAVWRARVDLLRVENLGLEIQRVAGYKPRLIWSVYCTSCWVSVPRRFSRPELDRIRILHDSFGSPEICVIERGHYHYLEVPWTDLSYGTITIAAENRVIYLHNGRRLLLVLWGIRELLKANTGKR